MSKRAADEEPSHSAKPPRYRNRGSQGIINAQKAEIEQKDAVITTLTNRLSAIESRMESHTSRVDKMEEGLTGLESIVTRTAGLHEEQRKRLNSLGRMFFHKKQADEEGIMAIMAMLEFWILHLPNWFSIQKIPSSIQDYITGDEWVLDVLGLLGSDKEWRGKGSLREEQRSLIGGNKPLWNSWAEEDLIVRAADLAVQVPDHATFTRRWTTLASILLEKARNELSLIAFIGKSRTIMATDQLMGILAEEMAWKEALMYLIKKTGTARLMASDVPMLDEVTWVQLYGDRPIPRRHILLRPYQLELLRQK